MCPSSFTIIMMGKRELVALLWLSSWCLVAVIVLWLFPRCCGLVCSVWLWYFLIILTLSSYGSRHEKRCLQGFANNKGPDQPVHPRSLISAFVIRLLKSVTSRLAFSEISNFELVSVADYFRRLYTFKVLNFIA